MCGIYCSIAATGHHVDAEVFQALSQPLKSANGARGPDAQTSYTFRLPALRRNPSEGQARGTELQIEFFASELLLRGHTAVVQPHQKEGDVFCWNGEVFEGLDIGPEENDGAKLFARLRLDCTVDSVPGLLGNIEGPYAFVFYHSSSEKLYFARDPLGRRSLLLHRPSPSFPYLLLSSVSAGNHPAYQFEELSTESILCLDVGRMRQSNDVVKGFDGSLSIIPRRALAAKFAEISRVNTALPPKNLPSLDPFGCGACPEAWSDAVNELVAHLDRSVMLRVKDIPFQFGQGRKARVAVLFSGGIDSTMLAFLAHRHVPGDETIDLINVAFENPRKIQVQLGGKSDMLPKRERKRYRKVADGGTTSYLVPDRITGLQEVEELRKLCPGRTWNFVEVDVPYEESLAARSGVEAVMWPSRTVMDLSLAMALYFASRGVGRIRSSPSECYQPYTSHARVLLNGLGSDELLGGYGRHRTAFTARGWGGVIDELQLELDRIPTRNLGRDDRIISSHGKETRHPFLSLSVVSFLAGLPVYLKLDPRLDVGKGDKTLLRLAAHKLGLVEASARKKRAMQFGSHSARMEAGGSERRGELIIVSPVDL
ncbi:asparagine synthase-domain-containing protein [Pisolithus orientalis]|uniref:asparagine synthase-domain-containing protein n=1 Tax=Pisolithus orientalis TaxID=936130 RepID=UPI0022259212|nr:asparagine synthase-domain-containing protein [Pisolithus orientalis]KAI6005188.1 asparagine synthase-domain-containing protein [Pisolithus orientalis]